MGNMVVSLGHTIILRAPLMFFAPRLYFLRAAAN
jgi:hypothetical protein